MGGSKTVLKHRSASEARPSKAAAARGDISNASLQEERLAHIVRRVMRDFQVSLELDLVAHGVNYGFWFYLRELWQEEGLSQRALSQRVGLSGPTTNSVIKRMVHAGLVALKPIVPGKPRQVVYLTESGRALRSKLEPLAEALNDNAVEGLSPAELASLRASLLVVHANLQRILNARSTHI